MTLRRLASLCLVAGLLIAVVPPVAAAGGRPVGPVSPKAMVAADETTGSLCYANTPEVPTASFMQLLTFYWKDGIYQASRQTSKEAAQAELYEAITNIGGLVPCNPGQHSFQQDRIDDLGWRIPWYTCWFDYFKVGDVQFGMPCVNLVNYHLVDIGRRASVDGVEASKPCEPGYAPPDLAPPVGLQYEGMLAAFEPLKTAWDLARGDPSAVLDWGWMPIPMQPVTDLLDDVVPGEVWVSVVVKGASGAIREWSGTTAVPDLADPYAVMVWFDPSLSGESSVTITLEMTVTAYFECGNTAESTASSTFTLN